MLLFDEFNYNWGGGSQIGRKQGLHYFKRLFYFSPQRCDCYVFGELLRYHVGLGNMEMREKMFIHLEEFNCQACKNKLKDIKNRQSALYELEDLYEKKKMNLRSIEELKSRKLSKKKEREAERVAKEWSRQTRKLMGFYKDMRIIHGDLEDDTPPIDPHLEVGQVWLSRLSKKRKPGKITLTCFPCMWPLLISEINMTEQTIKVLPLSRDLKMSENNFTYELTGDKYWDCALVEYFNEFTTTRDQLVKYKGELTAAQWRMVEENRSRVEWDFPMIDDFSDWAGREQELSAYLRV
jgi:hypothetical protein